MKSNINIFKRFFFDFTFCLLVNSVNNQKFLFFIDLLEIFPLALIYLNPFFSYLTEHPIFTIYFQKIYPYFYFFHQNPEKQTFPACLFVFTILFIIVALLRKQKTNIILTIIQIGLSLFPLMIFRAISQITNISTSYSSSQLGVWVKVCGIFMGIVVLFLGSLLIYWFKAFGKCCDFVIAILLCLRVNQYIFFVALGIKNILNFFLYRSNRAKQAKIATQWSLFVSIILLKFIKPLVSNYIILVSIVGLSICFAAFRLFSKMNRLEDLGQINFEGEKQKNYTFSNLSLLKNIETHIKNCAEAQCLCREVFRIKKSKDLIQWRCQFEKRRAKLNFVQIQKSLNSSDNFVNLWEFVKHCSSSQDLDFQGYLLLHNFHPLNIFQQYIQYHYIKIYRLVLQKQAPNKLKMNIVNWDEDNNPYNDFFQLENKICKTIDKIKVFWKTLVHYHGQNSFITLIEQISNEVTKIKQLYSMIDKNYDQKDEVDHYYNIFKILSLHQVPQNFHIDVQKANYFLVTRGQNIVNMTTNFTNLVERQRNDLIGHNYNTLLHQSYLYDHSEWTNSYFQKYNSGSSEQLQKIISTRQNRIKVVQMSHAIIPFFSEGNEENQTNISYNKGIYVVSIINQCIHSYSDDLLKKQIAFHLLLNRQTLDILSYEYSIFEYFGTEPSIDISNKVLRSNLQQIFPNINKQSLEKNQNQNRVLLAKENRNFFSPEQNNLKVSKLCELNKSQTQFFINKTKENEYLEVKQVLSKHNKQLNLLLLKFIVSKNKKGNEKLKRQIEKIDMLKQYSSQQLSSTSKQLQNRIQQKKKLNPDEAIKLSVFLTSLLIFAGLIAFHATTDAQFFELKSISGLFYQKSKFYTDFEYTKAFFLNIYVGQNRLIQLEHNWKYVDKYSSMLTIFKVQEQENFIPKLSQFISESFQKVVYSELYEEEAARKRLFQSLKNVLLIFCYCFIFLITINQVLVLLVFVRNQVMLEKGLQKFILIPTHQISKNLEKIQQLERVMEVIQHRNSNLISTQVDVLNIENSEKLPSQSPSYSKIDFILQKRKCNQSNLSVNITKRNSSIQQILSSYIADSTIRGGQNYESSISMLHRKQARDNSKSKYCQNFSFTLNNDNQGRKSLRISFSERCKRNIAFIFLKIISLSMKIGCFFILFLYLQKNYSYLEVCLELQETLFKEPAFILRSIELEYLEQVKAENFLSKYEYELQQLLSASLPQQFNDFIQYSRRLDSTQQSLCSFLIKEEELKQCMSKLKLFSFGKSSLLQYIQERLRQGKRKPLNLSTQLTQKSDLNLALKILLGIQKERNDKFEMHFAKYNAKIGWVVQFSRYITITLLSISFLLQIAESQYLSKRKEKTQNLFKIVPHYIKQALQISNDGK